MKNFEIGDTISEKRRFSKDDVQKFGELTGDFNPVHFNAEFASKTIFKRPIVHGPLVITLITTLFAKEMPGPGSVYLSHDVKYLRPVFIEEEVEAVLEVIDINEKGHYFIKTICFNENNEIVIEGIARLKKY